MAGRGFADIVFCIDASASMQPCFDAVTRNIDTFLKSLNSNQQMRWDWRLEFVAYNATNHGGSPVYGLTTTNYAGTEVSDALYHSNPSSAQFFTTDPEQFRHALNQVTVHGEEVPLVALDCCLDMPWRKAQECHRIVIMLTDEPFETSLFPNQTSSKLDAVIDKIHKLKVMLFLVAPDSPVFEKLASADKCEYEAVIGTDDGLRTVDFAKVLGSIGKSISVSTMQSRPVEAKRGLFDQAEWTSVHGVRFTGA